MPVRWSSACRPTTSARTSSAIVRALGEVFGTGLDGRVLVVDDASPDGTGEIADRLAAELPWVDVLHRARKEGLGPAYLAGFRRALADGAELVIEMDATSRTTPRTCRGSSPPPRADLVLGSRYVPGGARRELGPGRRRCQRGRFLYAQVVLGLGLRDLTGGFKCFRREVLERSTSTRSLAKGYAFQIETTYRACARASASSRSRSRSSTARWAARRCRSGSSPRRSGRCRSCAWTRLAGGCRRC